MFRKAVIALVLAGSFGAAQAQLSQGYGPSMMPGASTTQVHDSSQGSDWRLSRDIRADREACRGKALALRVAVNDPRGYVDAQVLEAEPSVPLRPVKVAFKDEEEALKCVRVLRGRNITEDDKWVINELFDKQSAVGRMAPLKANDMPDWFVFWPLAQDLVKVSLRLVNSSNENRCVKLAELPKSCFKTVGPVTQSQAAGFGLGLTLSCDEPLPGNSPQTKAHNAWAKYEQSYKNASFGGTAGYLLPEKFSGFFASSELCSSDAKEYLYKAFEKSAAQIKTRAGYKLLSPE